MHDVGKLDVPDRLRHPEEGFSSASSRPTATTWPRAWHAGPASMGLAAGALQVLAQHHEHGRRQRLPAAPGLRTHQPGARMVAIVNRYDNLCNPVARHRADAARGGVGAVRAEPQQVRHAAVLNAFIRMMGVYPAGSLVQLTDDRYAMVVGVNSSRAAEAARAGARPQGAARRGAAAGPGAATRPGHPAQPAGGQAARRRRWTTWTPAAPRDLLLRRRSPVRPLEQQAACAMAVPTAARRRGTHPPPQGTAPARRAAACRLGGGAGRPAKVWPSNAAAAPSCWGAPGELLASRPTALAGHARRPGLLGRSPAPGRPGALQSDVLWPPTAAACTSEQHPRRLSAGRTARRRTLVTLRDRSAEQRAWPTSAKACWPSCRPRWKPPPTASWSPTWPAASAAFNRRFAQLWGMPEEPAAEARRRRRAGLDARSVTTPRPTSAGCSALQEATLLLSSHRTPRAALGPGAGARDPPLWQRGRPAGASVVVPRPHERAGGRPAHRGR
jgi:hypothetical protein